MSPEVVNLFDYSNFRSFLEDYQTTRQARDPLFTKGRLCKDLGVPNTRSYFNDIVRGTRPLSKTYIDRFVEVFKMDEGEELYFRALVEFGQTPNDKERELLFDQLIALNRTPLRFVEPDKYAFYKSWHHTAVFFLLDTFPFKSNYTELARRVQPAISPEEARESIALLNKLELIRKNDEGVWQPTHKTLDAGPRVKDELVKQYQLQCLDLAKQAMMSAGSGPGSKNISTVTLSVSEEGFRQIEKKLQKFKAEVRSIAHKDALPADRVYQLNIQYFPQSSLEGLA